MIESFHCIYCGADQPSDAKEYDGMLGYEAIVCHRCGSVSDITGTRPLSSWGCFYVGLKEVRTYVVINKDKLLALLKDLHCISWGVHDLPERIAEMIKELMNKPTLSEEDDNV